jgi:F-type H+-transporting ATPase subunit b
MLIDWFTVGAQLLNFLILGWLMKRFLYQPILAAIAGREQRIAGQLADADRRQKEAGQLSTNLAAKTADLDRQRAALLADAVAAAQAEQQRLLDQGRASDAALRQRNDEAMRAEQQRLYGTVTAQASEEVLAVTRRVLSELADESMEAGMVRLFLRRLTALDAAARAQLSAALAAAPDSAVLRSALPLNADQQAALTQALRDAGLATATPRFDGAPGLVCGIEFSVSGWSLAWNIDGYLNGLAQRVAALLHATDSPAQQSRPSVPASAAAPQAEPPTPPADPVAPSPVPANAAAPQSPPAAA